MPTLKQHNEDRKKRAFYFYAVVLGLSLVCVVYFLWALRSLLLPIILGALLAYIFKPLLNKFKVSWIPNGVRVMALLGVIVLGLTFLTKKIKSNLPNEKEQLELQVRLQYKLNEKYKDLMGLKESPDKGNFVYGLIGSEAKPFIQGINESLTLSKPDQKKFLRFYRYQKSIPEKYYKYYLSNLNIKHEQLSEEDHGPAAVTTKSSGAEDSKGFVGAILNALSTWLLLPFVFIFLLFDNGQILQFFVKLIPNRFFELSLTIFDEVDQAIGNYLRGTLLECSLVGATMAIGLYVIGFQLNVSLVVGLIAGLTNAIPFLGPAMGLLASLSYGLIVEEIYPVLPFVNLDNLFVAIIILVVLTQLLDNSIYQPIVLGSAVNLHPLVVIIGVMGASVIFGFAGMLLAIPAIVIIKVVFETLFHELRAYRII